MRKTFGKMALGGLMTLTALVATSCRKDDEKAAGGGVVKITLTVPNAEAAALDQVMLTVSGSSSSSSLATWKLNGAVQTGQGAVGLNTNDFTGTTKTYVIESTGPVEVATVSVQLINFENPMNYSFKLEKGGKVIAEEANKTLSGNGTDFTKLYSNF